VVSVEAIDLESSTRLPALGSARNRLSYDHSVVRSESGAPAGFRLRIANAFKPEPIGDLCDANGIVARLLRPGRPYADLVAIDLNAVSFYRGRCATDVALRGQWQQGSLAVAAIELTERPVTVMGQRFDQGSIMQFEGGAEFDAVVPQGAIWTLLLLRSSTCCADLRRLLPGVPRELSSDCRDRLFQMARDLTVSPSATASRLRARREADAVERDLVESFAAAVLTAQPVAAANRKGQRRYDLIRRAEREALRVATEPPRLPQLAEAAGASPRLLEYAYRDLYGMGAMQCLRLLRLNEVHRALLRAGSRELTITSVAFEWGFYHLGDFSAAYKRLFGESPSSTLKRGRHALWPLEGVAD
jgi:AraC-like DNA-binding protein